jgi:hypothetical protein
MEKAKCIGIEAYIAELNEKIKILECLLESYNDGRRKSFYCLAVNLLDLVDIRRVMSRIADEVSADLAIKEKAKACVSIFEETAADKGVSLKLRKAR